LRIRLLFFGIGISVVIVLIAVGMASYGLWQGAQTENSTREALCQVLLRSRELSIQSVTTEAQIDRILSFYNDVIGLVEGCHISPLAR
jgi:hypothetical protein